MDKNRTTLGFDLFKIPFLGLCAVLMLLCTAVGATAYLALGMTAAVLLFSDDEYALVMLIFLMPFAAIFKSAPGTTSFFTYLILLYCVKKLYYSQTISGDIILFAGYIIFVECIAQTVNVLNTIKLIANLLFIQYALESKNKCNPEKIYRAYIIGVIVSSCFALLDSDLFRISLFTGGSQSEGGDYVRFVGLNSDPNYYVINVIVALCLLCILFINEEVNLIFLGTAAAILFYFMIITYSKSAMLMMCIPLALFYRVCQKNNYYWVKKFFFLGVVIAFILLLSGKISIFDTALKRFSIGSTGGKSASITLRQDVGIFGCGIWIIIIVIRFRHFLAVESELR